MKTNRRPRGQVINFPGCSHISPPQAFSKKPEAESRIDLDERFIKTRGETFVVNVCNNDEECGVLAGDMLIVDRLIPPALKDIVIVGEVGNLKTTTYKNIKGRPVFGVATFIIHPTR